MSLRFVLGRAGAGKTWALLEHVAGECSREPEGPPLLLLVPEQASFQTEQALARRTGGYVRARVLSFSRLASLVLAEQASPNALPHLSALHRSLLVSRLVARRRQSGESGLFAVRGIEAALAAFVSEAGQYLIDEAALATATSAAGPTLRQKLEQLRSFLAEYRTAIRARFRDPAETLSSLADAIATTDLLAGAEVFLDGFAGFTPVEERVVIALLRRCRRVHVALIGDHRRYRDLHAATPLGFHPIFQPAEETYHRLRVLADAAETGVEAPTILAPDVGPRRWAADTVLARLEARFLNRSAPTDTASAGEGLRLVELPSRRDEARHAAELCRRWILHEGVPPSEIAIITRSLAPYAAEIKAALTSLGIPHFLDRVEGLGTHPIVQGTAAALRVLSRGWFADDVLDFARSGLVPVARLEVDRLAAYCAACPPAASDWLSPQPWPAVPRRTFEDDEDPGDAPEAIDRARRAIAAPLAALRAGVFGEADPDAPIRFGILLDQVRAHVFAALEPTTDDAERAIRERFTALMDEAAEALGAELLPIDEAAEQVMAVLQHLALPRIPPLLGQVIVSQVDRSRLPPLRRAIVLGLNEEQWPALHRNGTLLNDEEREFLRAHAVRFADSSRREFRREPLFAYIALTRASERLVLSRATSGSLGESIPASTYWHEVRRLFPSVPVESPGFELVAERAARPREFAAVAYRDAFRTTELGPWQAPALEVLLPSPLAGTPEARCVERAARDVNRPELSPAFLHEAWRGRWRTSVSALETFASCPFKHFVRAMLRPEESLLPRVEPRDLGNLAHKILERLTAALIASGVEPGRPDPASRDEHFHRVADPILGDARRHAIFRSGIGGLQLEGVAEATRAVFEWLCEFSRAAGLRPALVEASFGMKDSQLPALERRIETPAGSWQAELRGKIDRVDVTPTGRGLVLDFKLRSRTYFDPRQLLSGEQLQLAVYALVLGASAGTSGAPQQLGGAVNLSIHPDSAGRHAAHAGDLGAIRARGFVDRVFYEETGLLGDSWTQVPFVQGAQRDPDKDPNWGTAYASADFQALLEVARRRLDWLLGELLKGTVLPHPAAQQSKTACANCDYRMICRFDPAIGDYRSRPAETRAGALQRLREEACT